ncbi:hypothetical protein PR048_018874 [Dryococelus australis]|uniref:Uncharacterized protein n=1 Tax=Dryococelus australis TaxID=614101 RepID=A0ABQ9H1W9_9NEOP|nr:hypothetical protein PR048_018874 [Dryococelus australis]
MKTKAKEDPNRYTLMKTKAKEDPKRYTLMKTKAKEDPNRYTLMKTKAKEDPKRYTLMTIKVKEDPNRYTLMTTKAKEDPNLSQEMKEIRKKEVSSSSPAGKNIEKIQTHFLSQVLEGGRVKTKSDKKGREKKQSSAEIERDIRAVFEDARNSRIIPGKDVIKSESCRQLVLCLEDDMNNLYEKFKKEDPSKRGNISYSTFARYRPKWAKKINVDERETCLCTRHANTKLENCNCKFSEETQAFHFGGSRKQVPLHTMVTCLHDKNSQIDMPYTIHSFCTLSDCLDHGVHAIWAHLKPILKTLPDYVKTIHFWSESPSTQYLKKKMFTVLSQHFRDLFPIVQHFTWNHHEAAHGKGAPDGIGGTCKRTADNLLSQGKYIPDVVTLISALKENIDKITIEEVTKDDIDEMKQRFTFKDVKASIGTTCVYQVVADAAGTTVLHMRELSCLACSGECPHYGCGQYPGQLKKELNVDEVYGTNLDDGDDLNVTIKRGEKKDVAKDIVREEDVRVEYLVRCSKEHDLFKRNPNSVDHECIVSDIINIVLNPTIINK